MWGGDAALFDSIFVFENFPFDENESGELGLSMQPLDDGQMVDGIRQTRGRNSYPVSLIAGLEGEGLQLLLSYQRQRFSDQTIDLLLGHLKQLLQAFVAQAEQPLVDLNWLSVEDRLQQQQWGQGKALELSTASVAEIFANQVAAYPEREAVGDGQRSLSYAELDQRSDLLAQRCLTVGLTPGDTLALALSRSVDQVVALVAALKAGLIYVPLDTSQPVGRLAAIVADSGARLVLSAPCLSESLQNALAQNQETADVKLLQLKEFALDEKSVDGLAIKASLPAPTADATAYLIYTSGSTGTPKGVAVSHRAIIAYTQGILDALSLPEACRFASVSTLAADLGNTQLFGALLSGGYLHLVDDNTRFDASALADLFAQQRIDVLKLTPGHLQGLLSAKSDARLLPRHSLLLGGEALEKGLLQQIQALAPKLSVYNHYGPSEATVGALLNPLDMAQVCADEALDLLSLGGPQPNRQVRILDQKGQPLPSGVPGEIYLGGEGLADGYHQLLAMTAERFVSLPALEDLSAEDTAVEKTLFYRTGDRGCWLSDGTVRFMGRQDNQVKIRGYRVELDEVAYHLSQVSKSIRQAVANLWQEDKRPARLVAWLVAEGDLNIQKLKHDLGQQLPAYMVPDEIVQLDQIPVTGNGKVDYKRLPAPVVTEVSENHQPPVTESEIALAQIWSDLLQRDAISVNDNFFALGGDSIMLLQVITRAQKLGLALTPALAFQYRTLSTLAAAIDGDAEDLQKDSAETTDVRKVVPFTPGQQQRLEGEMRPLWCLLQLPDAMQQETLATALSQLQQHYYPFTLVQNEQGEWLQSQNRQASGVTVIAADQIDSASVDTLAASLFVDMQQNDQPWLGAALSDQHLLLCAHPLALDTAAWPLLLADLTRVYTQSQESTQSPNSQPVLATSGFQQMRYLEAEQQRALSEDLEESWEYWLEHAGLELAAPEFAVHESFDTQASELTLSVESQANIKALIQSRTVTPVSLVTSALAALLARQQDTDTLALAVSAARIDLNVLPVDDVLSRTGIDASQLSGALDLPVPLIVEGLSGETENDWLQVSDRLQAMPRGGAEYGVLRYLTDNEYLLEPLLELPAPQAWVRWLGDWDSQMPLGSLVAHQDNLVTDIPLIISVFRQDGELGIRMEGQLGAGTTRDMATELTAELVSLLDVIAASIDAEETSVEQSAFPLCPEQVVLEGLSVEWLQVEDLYPLTPMQHGMVIQSLKSDQSDYLAQTCLQWDGPLNQAALISAWQQLVERHPVLRTVFLWRDLEQPLQCVLRQLDTSLIWDDISDLSAERQQSYIDSALLQERVEPLSLEKAPLTWLRVFRLSDQRFVLCHSAHHALSDAWSFGLLLDELLQCYQAHKNGDLAVLSPVRPFQHYLRWFANQPMDEARSFWQQTLVGFDTPTALPFMESAPLAGSSDIGSSNSDSNHRQLVLGVEETRKLSTFCQQQQITVNTLVQAAWALLLARCNDRQDVLFGVTVAGRPADLDGADGMQGLFIQTLPLRVVLDEDTRVSDWLQALLELNLTLRQHEYLPLTDIQQCTEVDADQSLFDSVMVFANAPMDNGMASRLPDCQIDFIEDRVQTEYPLLIDVLPGSRLELQFTFLPERFRSVSVDKLLGLMQHMLLSLAEHGDAKLADLTLISAQEQQQLAEFNQSANNFADYLGKGPQEGEPQGIGSDLPLNASYPELFARQVAEQPGKIAAVCMDQQQSYRELDLCSNRIGHTLVEMGAKPEQLVALLAERGLPFLNTIIATFKAGAAYMPLDPGLPASRLEHLLIQSEAPVLAASAQFRKEADELVARVSAATGRSVALCIIEDHWQATNEETSNQKVDNEAALPVQTTADSLAYVVFTSGSTGTPKGAMVEHRGMLNNMLGNRVSLGLSAEDRVAQVAAQSFDISIWQFLAAPVMGATVHIMPDEVARDPEALLQAVEQQQITLMELVPTQIRALLSAADNNAQLTSLRWLQSIGEALPAALVSDWLQRFPDTPILNAYGPAECSDNIGWHPITTIPEDLHKPIPVGRPTSNNQLYILDSAGREQPIGIAGEICAAGVSVGRGYWRDPERTAEVFVEHPFAPGERFYRTGDLGRRLDDGRIEYLGRRDFQLKLRGQRIEPGEIEACLEMQIAVDKAAVVIVAQDGHSYLVAYWQGRQSVAESELRAAVSQQLPAHMVPSRFVELEELPQNRNGKVDRKALMQKPVEFTQTGNRQAGNDQSVPFSETEQQLTAIWQGLLPVKQFGTEDSFFALGGHSLLATQVISRIRQELDISLPITALFKHSTIASLASAVEQVRDQQESGDNVVAIKPVSRSLALPLSYAQQRLWFMDQLEGADGAYNIPVALKLQGKLDRQAVQAAVDMILQRHEALRTGFRIQGDAPRQYIVEQPNSDLIFQDLSHLDESQQALQVQQLIDQEAERPFDLTTPPMLRVMLLRLAKESHVLQFTLHHIAADAWSLGVLVDEFTHCYKAFAEGAEPALTPLPIQYADYAYWQRSDQQQQKLSRDLDYWRQQLLDVPLVLDLPQALTQHGSSQNISRPDKPDYQGAAVSHTVSARQIEALKTYSQGRNATLFMVLLNAFNSLLQRTTDKHDFIVGTDVANREQAELEKLIGFFVNVLPLRAQLSDNESFDHRLSNLRDTTLGAYQHQQVSFDKLVEMLQPPRAKGINPLVQVLFVMQNTPKGDDDFAGLTFEELEPQGETSKFDLAVFLEESDDGSLNARWLYRTSLFDTTTIERLTQGFMSLLDYLTTHANHSSQPLEQWDWQFSQRTTITPESKGVRKKDKLKRLKSIKPTQISQSPAEQVKTSLLNEETQLPLIIEPKLGELDPMVWAERARDWIEEQLRRHGGLLFRGFNLPDATSFEQFSQAIVPELYGTYGDLPKNNSGKNIYHSTPYPEQHMILYHNESSHMSSWPCRQLFYCETPSPVGGRTPVADCREVYRELSEEVVKPLEEKGLLYVRHFTDKLDVNWRDFFKTDSRDEVEAYCREEGMRWYWLEDDGLRIEQHRPAVVPHPETGDKSFFNQVQLHHESCLEPEVRANLKALFGPDSLPRNVYYGDGTPISDEVMTEIGRAYEACAVRFYWQKGDVVMVDNMLVAHARDPFEGDRKICVAMGKMRRDENIDTATVEE
ncbi:non-ribosomal peptide synthetase [Oceanospirillum beijerinckii]|uniref:non-ribosomal peptide synthetase n=1 Tax=Oceanospirillum beijerinckii TaxID=64976 RepID=UPI00040E8EB1|nr:non-ribosomal peptide synthetase [Oceanospirillum beijerinckii]